ncbi:hypothetical protein LTR04_006321 [Oleoguttula sp. CCFEE 6159]|nr:hypothetical protein LTR04_006321 [Oleoguttula sp. CCFEE 6159]
MSRGTSEAFFDVIEWAAEQPWSSGKVGLLGISYYAGSQWRVAARQPKGLSAIIPWEGMSDYYRDRCRHGGILSNAFIKFWWDRQVITNQYGRPGRNARNWGPDTIEGDLSQAELEENRQDQTVDNTVNKFRDDLYYASKEYDSDRVGWSIQGKIPAVDLVLRKGDVGVNDAAAEQKYTRREEAEWPIARTRYTRFFLTPDQKLTTLELASDTRRKLSYKALGTVENPQLLQFSTEPFAAEAEITGHIVAHLNVSMSPDPSGPTPTDIDLFVTLRHILPEGKEVHYTGTAGDPVPLAKGWLRVSLRRTNPDHPKHRPWLPHRDYTSTDILPVIPGEVYAVDIEVWPTNVVVEIGSKIVFEVSSGDTQGCGIFRHDPSDRSEQKLRGSNHIHFGPKSLNYVTLPIIPPKSK